MAAAITAVTGRGSLLSLLVLCFGSMAQAEPIAPVYATTFHDATTFQNAFTDTNGARRWTISPGADDFTTDLYERPVVQNFRAYTDADTGETKFATDGDYWGNLDITQAQVGFDSTHLYFAIELHDTHRHKTNGQVENVGLSAEYRIRIASNADGSNGYMFAVQNPYQNLLDHGSGEWNATRNYVYWDQDGDVPFDGPSPDLANDLNNATGYETEIVNDGAVKSGFTQFGAEGDMPFLSRIRPGGDNTIVEFAIDYEAFGLSELMVESLPYLEFESNRVNSSSASPDKYFLNHVYSRLDAGSPYAHDQGADWGTQGPKDINEIDTLRAGGIAAGPEPSSFILLVCGFVVVLALMRLSQRHQSAVVQVGRE